MYLTLRAARPTDATVLAQVQHASITSLSDLLPANYISGKSADKLRELWSHELTTRARKTFLAEADNGQIAGFVSFGAAHDEDLADVPAGEVVRLYLGPKYIGQGAGLQLLDCATSALKNSGHDPIMLWVFEANVRARKFYEAHGFASDGSSKMEDGLRMLRYFKADR